ncbi:C6 transcription factor [Fonsecaea pedrosoi]|nr:C6 transcription factor [Fonsecaea pedrosoi]
MSQRLRPITPANLPPDEPGGSFIPTRGRSITRNSRSNATAACLSCKAKRRKCSGPPGPCNACITFETECVFREDLDRRRKEAIKRKMEGTEHHRDLLTGLLRSIRSSDENDAQRLFRLIRDDAPVATINAFIDESVRKLRDSSPKTDATIDGLLKLRAEAASLAEQVPTSRARRKTMSVEQMTDEPLFQLRARPWTTVTDDDYLVSHLVSLYFTWWNTFMHPLHEPALIEAMVAGDAMSPLCSPFLVNALLALSCSYSDLPGAFSDPDDLDTWGEHFYDEARRLWDREEVRSSMTNLQGLYLLMLYQNMRGKDQLGWSTMSQVVHMYRDMDLGNQVKIPRDCPAESVDRMRTAMLNVSWSVFTCNTNTPLLLMERLRSWHDTLSATLQAHAATPGLLFELHAIYYACSLTLSEVSARDGSPGRTPVPASFTAPSKSTAAITARTTSLLLIRRMLPLYRQFRSTYGLVRVMAGSCQAAAIAYFILLKALRDPSLQSEENEEALVDLTMYLMVGARRWLVFAGMLRMLRPTAQSMGVQLPPRLVEILDDFDKTVWTTGAHKRIRSVYPNLALVKRDAGDSEDYTMGELLARWEAVLTDDQPENLEDN